MNQTHQTRQTLATVLLVVVFVFLSPAASLSAVTTPSSRQQQKQHVVVVGGGVGGLAIAARLASSATRDDDPNTLPCKVTLLEKNARDMIGGRCGSFDVSVPGYGGKFRHERGPSLLLLKSVYEELFVDCSSSGKSASDYGLNIVQCTPAYQVIFDDGDRIELGFPAEGRDASSSIRVSNAELTSVSKMNSYEPDGHEKWKEYMAACSAFLDCGLPNFIEERLDLPSFPAFIYEALRGGAKAWPLKPHSDVLDAIFESNKMKALASFQDLYVGLEPYRNDDRLLGGVLRKTAPAVFGILAALELHPTNSKAGVFAPIGGFRAVSSAFERLCGDCGVQTRFDTTVTRIDDDGVHIISNGKAGFVQADSVVVNADLPFATASLVESNATTETYDWNDKYDFSSGVVAFHWSLDMACNDLNTHNVFLSASSSGDAVQSWTAVRDNVGSDIMDGSPFNFYVHRASKTDPSAAPEGCDAIMVLVPTQTLERREEYPNLPRKEAIERYKEQFDEEYIGRIKTAVLKRMSAVESLQGLEGSIIDEVVDTPATYADYYNLAAGTPFALSHGFSQLSLTRPSPRSKHHGNAFFVGASTRPGNGVPLVLLGAKAIARQVLSDMEKSNKSREEEE